MMNREVPVEDNYSEFRRNLREYLESLKHLYDLIVQHYGSHNEEEEPESSVTASEPCKDSSLEEQDCASTSSDVSHTTTGDIQETVVGGKHTAKRRAFSRNSQTATEIAERRTAKGEAIETSRVRSRSNLRGKVEDQGEKTRCSICLSAFNRRSRTEVLPCSHLFHADCLKKWKKVNITCPICRAQMLTIRNTHL